MSQALRFHDTCYGCAIQAAGNRGDECFACVERSIIKLTDMPCCSTCKAPMAYGTCDVCAELTFDGASMVLDRLGIGGIGKTIKGEDFKNRKWLYLGSGVCAFKEGKWRHYQSLYFPLRALFMRKLRAFIEEVGGQFDLVAAVPSSNELLPRLAGELRTHHTWFGLPAEVRADLLVKTTGVKKGPDHVPPAQRWAEYNATNLYQLAPGADVRGKRILVLDDIYKSGCSMNLCAKRLKEAGAALVAGFALCRWP